MVGDEFDWNDDVGDIVFPTSSGIAIYQNDAGEVIIRQEKSWDRDHDSVIIVPLIHAKSIAERILKILQDTLS